MTFGFGADVMVKDMLFSWGKVETCHPGMWDNAWGYQGLGLRQLKEGCEARLLEQRRRFFSESPV